ncbi:MAG: hypothetical protein ACYSSL_01315 [Planctomycetota bacterium]
MENEIPGGKIHGFLGHFFLLPNFPLPFYFNYITILREFTKLNIGLSKVPVRELAGIGIKRKFSLQNCQFLRTLGYRLYPTLIWVGAAECDLLSKRFNFLPGGA